MPISGCRQAKEVLLPWKLKPNTRQQPLYSEKRSCTIDCTISLFYSYKEFSTKHRKGNCEETCHQGTAEGIWKSGRLIQSQPWRSTCLCFHRVHRTSRRRSAATFPLTIHRLKCRFRRLKNFQLTKNELIFTRRNTRLQKVENNERMIKIRARFQQIISP